MKYFLYQETHKFEFHNFIQNWELIGKKGSLRKINLLKKELNWKM